MDRPELRSLLRGAAHAAQFLWTRSPVRTGSDRSRGDSGMAVSTSGSRKRNAAPQRSDERAQFDRAQNEGHQPEVIKHNIEDAFRRIAQVDAGHITVDAGGSDVTLRGEVGSWAERYEAQRTVPFRGHILAAIEIAIDGQRDSRRRTAHRGSKDAPFHRPGRSLLTAGSGQAPRSLLTEHDQAQLPRSLS